MNNYPKEEEEKNNNSFTQRYLKRFYYYFFFTTILNQHLTLNLFKENKKERKKNIQHFIM